MHQLTVSPLHNQAPHPIQVGLPDRLEPVGARGSPGAWRGWRGSPRRAFRVASSEAGPFFGNQLGELVLEGAQRPLPCSRWTERTGTARRLRRVLDLPVSR